MSRVVGSPGGALGRDHRRPALDEGAVRLKRPTFIELAAYILLREIAAASLQGLPTTLSTQSLYD